jgi:pSer/pThr/pTyr-binding forkhead associated (FHA) protein
MVGHRTRQKSDFILVDQHATSSSRSPIRVTLDVTAGPHRGGRFEFDRHDTFVVGRESRSHLCLRDDLHFSRHHLRIEVRPPQCLLIDLGSRNGTFVNGTKIREVFLEDGDIISGGNTKIRVSIKGTRRSRHDADVSTIIGPQAPPDTLPPSTKCLIGDGATPEFPGYEFLEELGRGTMGVVYRARQRAKGRTVAIKAIVPRPMESDEPVQLFTREASVLRQLKHRHIVRCHEFCFSGGQFFLVMEWVPTVPLESVLDGKSESSRIRIACAIACQILEALEYAHGLSKRLAWLTPFAWAAVAEPIRRPGTIRANRKSFATLAYLQRKRERSAVVCQFSSRRRRRPSQNRPTRQSRVADQRQTTSAPAMDGIA